MKTFMLVKKKKTDTTLGVNPVNLIILDGKTLNALTGLPKNNTTKSSKNKKVVAISVENIR